MLTAADIMTTDVITVTPDTLISEIAQLFYTQRISGVPVIDGEGHVLGIVSEDDLLGHADIIGERRRSWWLTLFSDENTLAQDYARTHGHRARDVMITDVVLIPETATIAEVARTMERNHIPRVAVVRGAKLVGIITRSNLLQALANSDVSKAVSLDDRTIRERLLAELEAQPWVNLVTKKIVVQDGIVHLLGLVASEEERRALCVAAENLPGVKGVEDQLGRAPGQSAG